MKIQIIIFPGFDELDAIAPYEVLKNAATMGADLQVELVTVDGTTEVTAAHGLQVKSDGKLEDKIDLLIIPGGGWVGRAPIGARAEAQRGDIPKAIASLYQNGTIIASVCTGAMLVATAGLLAGRPAITHHGAIEDLKESGAEIIKARVVDDGDIISAGGVTSGLDLALWLVERYFGSQIAHQVERELEYERRGTVWRR
jgi:transcriptional regulator GlxA family with amidase domain